MNVKLDPRETRRDLTSREHANILSGVIGSLVQMSESVEAVRDAVRWLAESDDMWEMHRRVGQGIREQTAAMVEQYKKEKERGD